jgi:hypothetical protein
MDRTLVSFRHGLSDQEKSNLQVLLDNEVNVILSVGWLNAQEVAMATWTQVGAPAGAVPVTAPLAFAV